MRTRRANGEGSVFRDKNNIWHSRIQIGVFQNGKPKYKEFKSKDQKVVIKKKKEYESNNEIEAHAQSAEQYLDSYIRNWLRDVKKNDIKSSSYSRAVSTVENYIVPYLGFYRIGDITAYIIQTELINRMRDEKNKFTGKPNSFSTIHKAYVYLHACLQYAVNNQILKFNPCATVTLPNAKRLDAREKRFLSDSEIDFFLKMCNLGDSNGKLGFSKYGWAYKFILYTGIRAGEMLALKKECVDIEHKRILICRTIIDEKVRDENGKVHTKHICQEATKNGRDRYVPLAQVAVECIKSHLNCNDDDYVITGSQKIFHVPYLVYEYKQICKKAGIENPQGIHTLRHTFASKLFREGKDVKTVSEILGHASIAFTYKTYVHLIEKTKDDAVSVWDA